MTLICIAEYAILVVDTTSFPFQSWTYPELSNTGAYTPDHGLPRSIRIISCILPNISVYTHEDIDRVVEYALLRGIRVIPGRYGFDYLPSIKETFLAEFDTPGHVGVGYAAIPNLLTTCYNGSGYYGTALNPTLDRCRQYMNRQQPDFNRFVTARTNF